MKEKKPIILDSIFCGGLCPYLKTDIFASKNKYAFCEKYKKFLSLKMIKNVGEMCLRQKQCTKEFIK